MLGDTWLPRGCQVGMLLASQDGASSSEDTAELVRRHMSAAMPSRAETVRREVQLALRTREDGPSSTTTIL